MGQVFMIISTKQWSFLMREVYWVVLSVEKLEWHVAVAEDIALKHNLYDDDYVIHTEAVGERWNVLKAIGKDWAHALLISKYLILRNGWALLWVHPQLQSS